MLQTIDWIFFDLGSTLIDETKADARRIREMIAGTNISNEAYCKKRFEMIRRGLPGDEAAIAYFQLKKAPWHSEEEVPYPDAAPTLNELKRRGYRLGVIANQNPGTEQRLAGWNLITCFSQIVASAETGVAKPDPAIFRYALQQAHCSAQNAAMIGDRLDNDIAPANRLGMHTVRILRALVSTTRNMARIMPTLWNSGTAGLLRLPRILLCGLPLIPGLMKPIPKLSASSGMS